MRLPLRSWNGMWSKLGFRKSKERKQARTARKLRSSFEPLEPRQMLAADVVITKFYSDHNNVMRVDYDITGEAVPEFQIGIYRSSDGVTLDEQLMTASVTEEINRQVGNGYGKTILATWSDLNGARKFDYKLVAVIDWNNQLAEENAGGTAEQNNQLVFEQGMFRASDGVVHVHGTTGNDTITLIANPPNEQVKINLNTGDFIYNQVTAVHVRSQEGNDNLSSSFAHGKVIWAWGSAGDDVLAGSPATFINDYLDGGPGNDSLSGNNGLDILVGGPGNDTLNGGGGNDTYIFSGSDDLGIDTITEGANLDSDTLDFSGLGAAITADLVQVTPTAAVTSNLVTVKLSTATGIENIKGTAYGDSLTGNDRVNEIWGNAGSDVIDGAAGLDIIHGGDGFDSPETLDNGEPPAYVETTPASWTNVSPAAGFNTSARQYTGGSSSEKARWTLPLPPGMYEVLITWPGATGAANVPVAVYDNTTSVGSYTVDQSVAPSGTPVADRPWHSLGIVPIASGTLKVELSGTTGTVLADAVRVVDRNHVPVLDDEIDDVTVDEDAADTTINLAVHFSDQDVSLGDVVTYSVTTDNEDLLSATISSGQLVLDYFENANGTAEVTVTATDIAGTSASSTFTVTVNPIADPPTLPPFTIGGPEGILEGVEIWQQIEAIDPDLPDDLLTFTFGPGAPDGAYITEDGFFYWLPDELQGGESFTFDIIVTDETDTSVSQSVTLDVDEVENDPVLLELPPQTFTEGYELSFTLAGSDDDLPAQQLTYSLVDAPAAFASALNATTGVFTWTPTESDGGVTYNLTLKVQDSTGRFTTETVQIPVDEKNESPVITNLPLPSGQPLTVNDSATQPVTFNVAASDPDGTTGLSYSILYAPPALSTASISAAGVFSWQPTLNDGGETYTVYIQVADSDGFYDVKPLVIDCVDMGGQPVITGPSGIGSPDPFESIYLAGHIPGEARPDLLWELRSPPIENGVEVKLDATGYGAIVYALNAGGRNATVRLTDRVSGLYQEVTLGVGLLNEGGGEDVADVVLSIDASVARLNSNWDEGQVDWDGRPIPDNLPDKFGVHGIDPADPDLIDAELTIPGGSGGTWYLQYPDGAFRVYLADGTPVPTHKNMPGATGATIPLKIEAVAPWAAGQWGNFRAEYFDVDSTGYMQADVQNVKGDLLWGTEQTHLAEDDEETPGGFIRLSDGSNPLYPVTLNGWYSDNYWQPGDYMTLGFTDNLKVWLSPNRTGEVTSAIQFAPSTPSSAFNPVVYVEGITAAAGGLDSQVWMNCSGSGSTAAAALDRVFVSVVEADLDIVLSRDEEQTPTLIAENKELTPGAYVGVNDDDDDEDTTADNHDHKVDADDDELVEVILNPVNGTAGGLYTLTYPSNVNIWRNRNRTDKVISDPTGAATNGTLFQAGLPTSVFVEGIAKPEGPNTHSIKINWKNENAAYATLDTVNAHVLKVEVLTRDESTGEVYAADVLYGSDAKPVVSLQVDDAHITDLGQLSITVSGTVSDRVSELADDPDSRVQYVELIVNGGESSATISLEALDGGVLPWQPRTFNNAFQHTFLLDHPGRVRLITARTSVNALGNYGWDKVSVVTAFEKFPDATDLIPGGRLLPNPDGTQSVWAPVVVATKELLGERDGNYEPMIVRVDGLDEAYEGDSQIEFNGQTEQLEPFVYSPKKYYVVDSLPGQRPRIYVVTFTEPSEQAADLTPDMIDIGQTGGKLTAKVAGRLDLKAEVTVLGKDASHTVVPATPTGPLTMEQMLTWFHILFGEEGLKLLRYYQATTNTIVIENVAFDWDVDGWMGNPWGTFGDGYLKIQIEKDIDPITGAKYLWAGLNWASPYFRERIPNNEWNLITAAQQQAINNAAQIAAVGATLYWSGITMVNEGADWVMTIQDLTEGNYEAAIGFLPVVSASLIRGRHLVLKTTAGTRLLELSDNALQAIKTAWTKTGLDERWKLIAPLKLSPDGLTALQKGGLLQPPSSHSGLRSRMIASGKTAPARMVSPIAHHDLPWAFKEFFAAHGIDCNAPEFGRWVPKTKHDRWHAGAAGGPFNAEWRAFIAEEKALSRRGKAYTQAEIFAKLTDMKGRYR